MKLWGGRFTKQTDTLVQEFNESLSFDKRLYKQDIRGSKAHISMLGEQGIVSKEDKELILKGLTEIEEDIDGGILKFDDGSEDIHSFVEAHLIEKIGEAGLVPRAGNL